MTVMDTHRKKPVKSSTRRVVAEFQEKAWPGRRQADMPWMPFKDMEAYAAGRCVTAKTGIDVIVRLYWRNEEPDGATSRRGRRR